jgi:N-acetylmuramoyl-L-alanine amidase
MMLLPNKIVLHCSATEDSESKSWEAIRDYHTRVRGWQDIGYHFGIERVDDNVMVYQGRPFWQRGAHCKAAGRNFDSIGICVVGKYDEEAPPKEIYQATLEFLQLLCFLFWIKPEDVYGHREFEKAKTCPGNMWDLDKLRDDLRRIVPELDSKAGLILGGFE